MTTRKEVSPMVMVLGACMRRERESMGLLLRQVAKGMGVSVSALCDYETGDRRIPIDRFVIWCQVMGRDPGVVLTDVVERLGKWHELEAKGEKET